MSAQYWRENSYVNHVWEMQFYPITKPTYIIIFIIFTDRQFSLYAFHQ